MPKRITTGYDPRPHQVQLHRKLKRFNVLVCHRRFGKTVFAINQMIHKCMVNPLWNPRYYYFAPYYGQAKRVAWDYLKYFTQNIPGAKANVAELHVDIPRPWKNDVARVKLMGTDNLGSLKGIYADGAVLDEYGEMSPAVWGEVLRPALSDRLGWAIFIGTPKGMNHFHDIREAALSAMGAHKSEWFTALYKASETNIILKSELEAARMTMSEEEYDQEFECSFQAALVGAYYGRQMADMEKDGRIKEVKHNLASPVYTAWDLGRNDSNAIWFLQKVGLEHHVINYVEDSGQELPYYARIVNKFRDDLGYNYEEHFLPWDAKAQHLGAMKTRVETLNELRIGRIRVNPKMPVEEGINASRLVLPYTWIDREKCKRGIDCLRAYEKEWDMKNKIFSSVPKHNWASNGADAFRTWSMGNKRKVNHDHLPRSSISDYDILNPGVKPVVWRRHYGQHV